MRLALFILSLGLLAPAPVWAGASSNLGDVAVSSPVVTQQALGSTSTVKLVGENGVAVQVDETGRLLVANPPAEAPADTTPVSVTEEGDVTGTDDNVYTITDGSTLTITSFIMGCEDALSGSKVALYIDDDGTGTTLETVILGYCSGSNFSTDIQESAVGDGSRAIRMRRERMGGGPGEIFGRWDGYEQ